MFFNTFFSESSDFNSTYNKGLSNHVVDKYTEKVLKLIFDIIILLWKQVEQLNLILSTCIDINYVPLDASQFNKNILVMI